MLIIDLGKKDIPIHVVVVDDRPDHLQLMGIEFPLDRDR